MRRETAEKNHQIEALRDAARYIQTGAGALSELGLNERQTIAETTGKVRDFTAERAALRAKAEDLLEIARGLAASDPVLREAWILDDERECPLYLER